MPYTTKSSIEVDCRFSTSIFSNSKGVVWLPWLLKGSQEQRVTENYSDSGPLGVYRDGPLDPSSLNVQDFNAVICAASIARMLRTTT